MIHRFVSIDFDVRVKGAEFASHALAAVSPAVAHFNRIIAAGGLAYVVRHINIDVDQRQESLAIYTVSMAEHDADHQGAAGAFATLAEHIFDQLQQHDLEGAERRRRRAMAAAAARWGRLSTEGATDEPS